jgi:hypothetical protein
MSDMFELDIQLNNTKKVNEDRKPLINRNLDYFNNSNMGAGAIQ